MQIKVKVITRSSKDEIIGEMADGTIKIKLKASPIKGQANESLIDLLSKYYKLPKSSISIKSGITSTKKVVDIT